MESIFNDTKEYFKENKLLVWFRKKYNLSPKDPRFLEVTHEEILQDLFLDKLSEDPNITLNEIFKDKAADDEWIKEQQEELTKEEIKRVFSDPKTRNDENFETIVEDTI